MIAATTYKKYPAYKDSGEKWLGQIPEHWEVSRLSSHFIERNTKVSDKDFPPLSVTKQGILPQLESAAKTNDGDNRKLVKKGDFVVNSRSDRKGSSGISNSDGSVSLINIVIKPISIHSTFCNYLLKTNAFMQSRKMKGNASYLAFTATPKNTTLERFGTKQEDGTYKPFHLYSMKQAIEEGFILDVLANYTTYKSYYEIQKSIQENPLFDTKKAQKKLRAFVERHKQTIGTKAEIIVEHFTSKVFNTKKLKGKAKAMVVTQDIKSAIRYYQAIKQILNEKGNPFKIAIAFSGSKIVDGIEYTEPEMNGFAEKDT